MIMSHQDMIDEKVATKRGDYSTVSLEIFLSSVDYNNTWYSKPLHEDGSEWSYWELLEIWEG